MNPVFTPSRELREYMRARVNELVRAKPSFKNVEWWDGDVFMVMRVRESKRCDRCDMLKPTGMFGVREKRNGRRFISNLCKSCEAEKRKEWRLAHPEREREYNRRYRAKRRAMREAA